jgi:sterol 3beta-glucosyltransferase
MRIVLVAIGTWGDVRPIVVLANALQSEGYEVLLMAAQEFRHWTEARHIPFVGLTINIQGMLDSVASKGGNLLASIKLMNQVVAPAMVQVGKEIADCVQDGDALLIAETGQSLVNGIVEKYHLRIIHASPLLTVPTREFPLLNLPSLPDWMPLRGAIYRLGGQMFRRVAWSTIGARGNQVRTEYLSLPKQTWSKHRALLESTPYLLMVSRHVIPRPADWPSNVRITGYLFDDDTDWQPPQDLVKFLDDGEKPVYIGFGSMHAKNPEVTTRMLIDGVQRSGRRAVLLTGWAGIGALEAPDSIFILKYAPHSWLFPRMAAVVHHGGAGTTAAGLRAGVPTIITPIIGDQPFWGQRLYELGVGTKPIPHGKLTAEKLAAAIQEATTDRAMQERAAELGRKIAVEDGVGEAVKAVKEFLS